MLFFVATLGFSQVTTSSIGGNVKDAQGKNVYGASVEVIHIPSGSKYKSSTNPAGNFGVPAVRPGGPYSVKVTYVGLKPYSVNDVYASLGNGVNLDVVLGDDNALLKEVVVKNPRNSVISKSRTGASQQFSKREINAVPIIGSRSINDITKYNANGNGRSFGSQDSRLNNFTVDGSVFNNGFGLGSSAQAGGRTGSTAISLDAIEQLQVNIAPFDVRQSGFVGAGINAVTRSGTNEIEGSVYGTYRTNTSAFLGTKAAGVDVVVNNFNEKIYGIRFGAPIIKDKLFIFGNYESSRNVTPATNWTSAGSPNPSGQVSLPTYAQMQTFSNFLNDKFGYQTGPWEGYDNTAKSDKFLIKFDYNLNDNNKLSARFIYHDSNSNQLISNSTALGNGNRTNSAFAMSFQNSGYVIQDNTRSAVLEWNSKLSETINLNAIVGYDYQNEDRKQSTIFPTIDIRNGDGTPATTSTLLSAGTDPFTPGNRLDYKNLHATLNLTKRFSNNTLLLGANFEKFQSNNNFYPGSNGVYTFNSLTAFYAAANQYITTGAPSTLQPARFQLRYSLLPGGAEPLQVLKSNKYDFYIQDEIKFTNQFRMTAGIRASVISFENTAIINPIVNNYVFNRGQKFETDKMPETQLLWEPRLGMNLDVFGNGKTQLRGGMGMFTGKPPYVFISNQIGNNGALTALIDDSNPAAPFYGFTPNPAQAFTPPNPTLNPATTFDLAFTANGYKFPQVFKVDLALDQKLPFGFIGTLEFLFNKNINEVFYYNANQKDATSNFTGPDNRPRFGGTSASNRFISNVSNAIVLDNSSRGYYESATVKLEYPNKNGLFGSIAYTIAESKDLMSAGSIASSSWTGVSSVRGNNNLNPSLSDNDIPHRVVGLLGYKLDYGKKQGGSTSISFGYVAEKSGRFSHTINGDLNGDLINGNDLMFVPRNAADLNFAPLTVVANGVTTIYSPASQRDALEIYIANDPYLNSVRGQYVERNAISLPFLHRVDMSITQEFFIKSGKKGKTNSLQIRADILNFGNLVNNNWGVSKRASATRLLNFAGTPASVTPGGEPIYTLATQLNPDGSRILVQDRFLKNASQFDVWQAQLGLRYTFN